MKKNLTLVIIAALVIILAVSGCNGYNGLFSANQTVSEKWSNVETNYQRRTDLYNSVIKTIQGSANFEKSTLKDVINARAAATQVKVDISDPATLEKYQQAQSQLQGAFGRLMAVAEAYPELKTTKAFQDFQTQIEGTENRINIARQDYNDAVKVFNNKAGFFPNNIWAGLFHFTQKQYYKADPGSEKAPDINFDIK